MYQNQLEYECDYCSRIFSRKFNLQTHIENCHLNATSHCEICNHSLKSPGGLHLHLLRGHNNQGQPYPQCDICGRTFTRKQNIMSHMITVHLQGLGDDIRCKLCDRNFTTERNLKRHINQIHNPHVEYPICHYCNKKFKGKYSLISHIQTKHYAQERKMIKCHLCDKMYSNMHNLKRHIEMIHGDKEEYMCDICPKVYSSNQSLRRHLRLVHYTESSVQYSCNDCDKVITGIENYESHIHYFHQSSNNEYLIETETCEICNQEFEDESSLRQHVKTKHSFQEFYKYCKNVLLKQYGSDTIDNIHNCEFCCYNFPTVYELKNHLKASHNMEYCLSECNVCFNKFYTKETMATHKKICIPPPNVNSCSHCDRLFTNISSLEFHTKIFHPQAQMADSNISSIIEEEATSFKCNHCDRMYYSDRSLKHHVKLKHTTDEQVECEYCNKMCSNKYYLASHIKIVHNNDSWSRCEYCDKEFKSKRNIRRHIEYTHLGMQRYKCIECETLFKEKRSLRKHVRTKHPNSTSFPQCHICHKRFESAKSCKIHLKLLHSFNMNTFPCHLCSMSFGSNEALNVHLNTKHLAEDEIYKCEECNLVFKGQGKFDIHKETCHVNLVSNIKQKDLPHCILCVKDFSTRKTLKRHIKKFHPNFEVEDLVNYGSKQTNFTVDCEDCVKKFTDEYHYNVYQKIKHLKDSIIFKCESCRCSYNILEYTIQRYRLTNGELCKTKTILSELCTTEMSEEESGYSGIGYHDLSERTSDIQIKSEPEDYELCLKMETDSP